MCQKALKKKERKERNEDATGVVEVHSESSLESGHTTPVNIHTLSVLALTQSVW